MISGSFGGSKTVEIYDTNTNSSCSLPREGAKKGVIFQVDVVGCREPDKS